jgi:hypothetical protein
VEQQKTPAIADVQPEQESIGKVILHERTKKFFLLGISVAKLLQKGPSFSTPNLVRASLQLFEEMEYYFSGHAVQSMRFMMAKPSPLYPNSRWEGSLDEPVKTHILRWDKEVVMQHFCTPHIPCSLDYFGVLFSLCDILTQLYQRIGSGDTSSGSTQPFVFDAMKKLDAKVKHHLVNLVGKELTKAASILLENSVDKFLGLQPQGARSRSSLGDSTATHLVLPSDTL